MILWPVIIIVAICILVWSDKQQTRTINSRVQELIKDGWMRETNPDLEDQYYREQLQLWGRSIRENNPDLFYPERHEFFKWHPQWATTWALNVACEKVIADGYAPSWTRGSFSMRLHGNNATYRIAGGYDAENAYFKSKSSKHDA